MAEPLSFDDEEDAAFDRAMATLRRRGVFGPSKPKKNGEDEDKEFDPDHIRALLWVETRSPDEIRALIHAEATREHKEQARVPAGSPEGGQFASDGDGGGGGGDQADRPSEGASARGAGRISSVFQADLDRALQIGAISQADFDSVFEAAAEESSDGYTTSDKELEGWHTATLGYIREWEDANAELPPEVANFQGKSLAEALPDDHARAQARTPEEVHALRQYKTDDFASINSYLRTGTVKVGYMSQMREPEQAQAAIEQIDKAMQNSVLEAPMTVFRGVSFDDRFSERYKEWDNIRPGSTISDAAFMSTSGRRESPGFGVEGAEGFAGRGPGSYMLTIQVPAGARAVSMDRYGVSGFSGSNEEELLFERGSELEVHQVIKTPHGGKEILASLKPKS